VFDEIVDGEPSTNNFVLQLVDNAITNAIMFEDTNTVDIPEVVPETQLFEVVIKQDDELKGVAKADVQIIHFK
jgi:secreted Zn-dependent insulinase-like peptidase